MTARRLVAIVTILLTLGCCLFGGMPSALAAGASPVSVDVESMSPAIAGPDTPLTITGSVTNQSDADVSAVKVGIGVSPQLLDTTTRVQDWSAGTLPRATPKVGGKTIGSIAAGATRQFSVTIAKGTLNYAYNLASLPMTIQVTGTGFNASPVRTTLEWSKKTPTSPLRSSIVVPLTLPADPALYGPSGSARTAAWTRAIGPGSRIDQLISDLGALPVTWVVDPSIVQAPVGADDNLPKAPQPGSTSTPSSTPPGDTASSSSAPVSTAPPTTSDGTGSQLPGSTPTTSAAANTDPVDALATTLLGRLQTLATTSTIWWTPYDDPDLTVLAGSGSAGQALLTRDLQRRLPTALRKISDVTVAWPDPAIGSTQAAAISSTWKRATGTDPRLLVPDGSVASLTGVTPDATRRVAGSSGTLVYDATLSSTLSTSATSPLLAAQRFMARTAAIYQQSPGTARSLAAVLPREDATPPAQLAEAITLIENAPWLAPTSGTGALSHVPTFVDAKVVAKPVSGAPTPAGTRSPINAATLSRITHDRRVMRGLGSILVDSKDVVTARTQSFDAMGSTRWRGHSSALATVVRVDSDAVQAMRRKISVIPSTVNFFANSGQLTVTVVNGLNRSVKDVDLSMNPRRFLLRIPKPDHRMAIAASSRSTVRFEVKAVAAGKVPIDAVLTTPDGLPLGARFGEPTQLQINVRPTSSWIYWVLGIVAGLVLVVGLIRSLWRGPRTVTAPGSDATDDRARPETPKAGEHD
ncbi:DUF6049 family protein [Leekyejoonella antrihumi]|uniref:Glycoprotein n=1 Tax=Leekyejoonella antrihumi TaxID=1660198 RepID=A0A563E758_9MICO|nr:DUF6049 family protein [Leekyejoonella antrihumi]TWP38265.1 hypothetical protein FGL98_03365 [Leekyejoonella antrihumi]